MTLIFRRRHLLQTPAFAIMAARSAVAAPADQLDRDIRGLFTSDDVAQRAALRRIAATRDTGAVAGLVQALYWLRPEDDHIDQTLTLITGAAVRGWFDWAVWQQDHPAIKPYPGYTALLADLLARVDPRFRRFVSVRMRHELRIEEIVWGGVRVDGIPALDQPRLIAATEASYLNDDDRVFGVEIAGDARAYPLRIADWHEMVNDTVGGTPVSLAYCTLCGAGILFAGRVAGRPLPFTFGSSGLLYRSNKLMYDRATDSLWNQFTGRPVSGVLTGSGIELAVLPVVLAPWSEWRRAHPGTRVLALETGFIRNYAAGAAYRDYFASDRLMFPASVHNRATQKDRAFGIRVAGGVRAWPLSRFHGGAVLNERVGLTDVVVIGDEASETVRAYQSDGRSFAAGRPGQLVASDGLWSIGEAALVGPGGRTLARVPGHIGYRFAWEGYFGAGVDAP